MYLITGVWLQSLSAGNVISSPDGIPIRIEKDVDISAMCVGRIFKNPNNKKEYIGEMVDACGEAELYDIKITPKTLSFSKKYKNRADVIEYRFKKRIWEKVYFGIYFGWAVGKDASNCTIQRISKRFFTPKIIQDSDSSK